MALTKGHYPRAAGRGATGYDRAPVNCGPPCFSNGTARHRNSVMEGLGISVVALLNPICAGDWRCCAPRGWSWRFLRPQRWPASPNAPRCPGARRHTASPAAAGRRIRRIGTGTLNDPTRPGQLMGRGSCGCLTAPSRRGRTGFSRRDPDRLVPHVSLNPPQPEAESHKDP